MSKIPQEQQRLAQETNLNYVRQDFGPTDMVPVYSHTGRGLVFFIFGAKEARERRSSKAF